MPAATDGMEEIVKEFLAESAEGLDRLERGLVELERDPGSRERLAEIFRAVHTIKGTSGMLGYPKAESVAHAGESLLGGLRDGELEPNAALISGMLGMADVLRRLLGAIERTGNEGNEDCSSVLRSLEELARCPVALEWPSGPAHDAATDNVFGEHATASGTIRVELGLLDRLMDLAGELVLVRNQMLRITALQPDSATVRATQRLKRLAADIQDAVMKARLQPIGTVWNNFPRLARDLALSCGKQVTVEMEGSETELDRGIIEAIRDPLTHILRNAIAHGIETPEQRTRTGKTAAGHLRLCAFHREGWVHVEISDDGAGIGVERVRQRALERGLITPEQASQMDERQLAALVFAPGFSTAEQVTSVSGRGVGLDVVRANIEKIGGVVDLRSVTGERSTSGSR
jgi:two-component system, chemotaxis family, sensor kinase CheA